DRKKAYCRPISSGSSTSSASIRKTPVIHCNASWHKVANPSSIPFSLTNSSTPLPRVNGTPAIVFMAVSFPASSSQMASVESSRIVDYHSHCDEAQADQGLLDLPLPDLGIGVSEAAVTQVRQDQRR